MYIHTHDMAKNIMVSNGAYEKLRKIKEDFPNMSYSDAILSMEPKKKTAMDLKEIIRKFRINKNDKKIEKELKEGWARWTKKYA